MCSSGVHDTDVTEDMLQHSSRVMLMLNAWRQKLVCGSICIQHTPAERKTRADRILTCMNEWDPVTSLTLCVLGKKLQQTIFWNIIFFFLPRKKLWPGNNLHEILKPIFLERKEKYHQLSSDELAQRVVKVITKTCLYNFDPLKPHFYIVKPGFTGVYIIFLISAQKHRLWYSLEPPLRGGSNVYLQSMFWAEIWKMFEFFVWKFSIFRWLTFSVYLNRHVFVMLNDKSSFEHYTRYDQKLLGPIF